MNRRSVIALGSIIAALGCADPESIRNPTVASLEKHVGYSVSIEGIPSVDKEGVCIDANGVAILVDIPISIADSWPNDNRRIRVFGTLVKNDGMLVWDFPFTLQSQEWIEVAAAQ